MKVVYDAQIFVEQAYGGISRYICALASQMAISVHGCSSTAGVPSSQVGGAWRWPKCRPSLELTARNLPEACKR